MLDDFGKIFLTDCTGAALFTTGVMVYSVLFTTYYKTSSQLNVDENKHYMEGSQKYQSRKGETARIWVETQPCALLQVELHRCNCFEEEV